MFCVRGFGGWLGFLLFWGLFWLSAWFLVLGFGVVRCSCSSWFFCAVVRGCGGRVAGGSGFGGRCGAPGSSVLRGVFCACAGWGVGRAGPGCRECFAGVGLRPVSRVFRGGWACFFPLGVLCSSVPVLVFVVLSGLGVLGGVGLGWGFFSGFCCSARAGAGSCLVAGVGVGCGLFGFCLESLILAQDERWRRA